MKVPNCDVLVIGIVMLVEVPLTKCKLFACSNLSAFVR